MTILRKIYFSAMNGEYRWILPPVCEAKKCVVANYWLINAYFVIKYISTPILALTNSLLNS